MSLELRPHESVLFPAAYVEGEPHLLLVINQRVLSFGDAGRHEMAARDISFVGRLAERPRLLLGAVLVVLALPLAAAGAWLFVTASGKLPALAEVARPPQPPAAALDDPAGPPGD